MFIRIFVLSVGCLLGSVLSALAQQQFQVAPEYPITSGGTPCGTSGALAICSAIAAGDFKGNGTGDDMAVVDSTGTVSIFLNNRNGSATFAAPTSIVISGGTSPFSIATGAFTQKGQSWKDLVVADFAGNVTVLSSNNGVFSVTAQTRVSGIQPTSMISVDVNGDGISDVVLGDFKTGKIWVLAGAGRGTLQPSVGPFVSSLTGSQPVFVAAANFTTPTQPVPDLAAVTQDGTAAVLQNLTSGTTINFNPGVIVSPPAGCDSNSQPPVTAVVAQPFFFSSDGGLADLAIASTSPLTSSCSYPGPSIWGLLNSTPPPFIVFSTYGQSSQAISVGIDPVALTVADVNADSSPDVVVASQSSNSATVLLNTSDGSGFCTAGAPNASTSCPLVPQEFGTGNSPVSVAAGNFHLGRTQPFPDLAVAHVPDKSGNVVTVLSNLGNGTSAQLAPIWLGYGAACSYNSQATGCTNNVQSARTDYQDGILPPVAVSVADFYSPYSNQIMDLAVAGLSAPLSYESTTATLFENDCNFALSEQPPAPSCLAGDFTSAYITLSSPSATANFESMVTADFAASGFMDLALVEADNTNHLYNMDLFLNSSVGFSSPVQVPLLTNATQYSIAQGTLISGHAQPDLVVADNLGNLTVLSNSNDGTATFTGLPPHATPSASFSSMVVGDLNGDGIADVVVADAENGSVLVFAGPVNSTSGAFAASPYQLPAGLPNMPQPVFLALGLNSSQAPVFLIGVSQDGTIALWPNTSLGSTISFGAPVVYAPSASGIPGGVTAVASADFNLDGFADVAIAAVPQTGPPAVWYLPNTSQGGPLSLGTAQSYLTAAMPVGLAVGDINQDGIPDLIIANQLSNTASVLISNGSFKLSPTVAVPTSSENPSSLGQKVTFTTTITGPAGSPAPTGTVQFFNGNTLLGSSPLNSSGVASLSTSTLPIGTDLITAAYSGNSKYSPRTSMALSQVVEGKPDFSLTISPGTATLQAGSSASFTVKAAPLNVFTGAITLACSSSKMPAGASCQFMPQTLTITANEIAGASTLTVVTTSSAAWLSPLPKRNRFRMLYGAWLGVASTLGLLGFAFSPKRRKQFPSRIFWLLVVVCLGQLACGGGSGSYNPGNAVKATPPGTYIVTVTGSAGAGGPQHNQSVTLVVQ
jgi:hypothetical protein